MLYAKSEILGIYMYTKHWIILGSIVLLAIILRFLLIGIVPISPDWDEAALGYNAYSILHTNRDEYGKFLPVVLRSFDDYKPALYSYLIIPFLWIFDLSLVAVRFPSAIAGVVTVVGVFFLVRELFKRFDIAMLASLMLAISPWHIQFSRIAFETNVGLMFNVLTALSFIKGLKNRWLLFLVPIFSSAALYVYQSEKVFTPLLLLTMLLIYQKDLRKIPKRYLLGAIAIGIIVISPLIVYTLTNKESFARARGVSVFSESTQLLKESAKRLDYDKMQGDIWGSLFDNRRVVFTKLILSNYFSHFSPNWLFLTGDIPRHHAPFMGLLYLWEVPFILAGIYMLAFGKYDRRTKLLIFAWFFIAPIPASITTGVPHAVRTLNFLPTYQIFTALGLLTLGARLAGRKWEIWLVSSYAIVVAINMLYFLDAYFIQQNYYFSKEWQYGYASIVPEVKKLEPKYQHIVVSNQPPMDQSYMFFLFYLKYDPSLYQEQGDFKTGGFRENHTFGKYEFRPIQWETEKKDKNTLYVGRYVDFPTSTNAIKTIDYLDGVHDMKIVSP